jgi:2TM domain
METEKDKELWKTAKKRVGFKGHLASYVIINIFFWVMWLLKGNGDENDIVPWPVWPMLGWGIGLTFHYLGAFVFTKHAAVEKEYEKLKNSK